MLSQQRIDRAEIIVPARVVGGIALLDDGEADDKIIAVLNSDTVFDYATDIKHLPEAVLNRIVHYFGTYKQQMTGDKANAIEVIGSYGVEHALEVVKASMRDYETTFPTGDRRAGLERG